MRLTCSLLIALTAAVGVAGDDRLTWEDVFDVAGKTDIARAVTATGNTVVLVGEAGSADGVELVLRAYNKKTGEVRWSDNTQADNGCVCGVRAASSGGVVYAATPVSNGFLKDIKIRAYSAAQGELIWEDVVDAGPFDFPRGLAANQHAVIVVGTGGSAGVNYFVRAYHPHTGEMLWEDRVGTVGIDDSASSVAITVTQVFVAGSTLRAYDVRTGTLLWEIPEPDAATGLVMAQAGRVVVTGTKAGVTVIAAFDASTGEMLWHDTWTDAFIGDLEVGSRLVVAVGTTGSNAIIRVLDVRTGERLWEDRTIARPGRFEGFSRVEVGKNGIYVTGHDVFDFPFTDSEVVIRAYDVNGLLLWEERAFKSPNSGAQDLLLNGTQLFLVGFVTQPLTNKVDFFARAYDVADFEPRAKQMRRMTRSSPQDP